MELNQTSQSLTELEQLNNLRNLSTSLPESRRVVIEEQLMQQELSIRTRQLKESGASEDELYQLRVELVGAEAAENLADLDKERAVWDQRVEQFRQVYQLEIKGIDNISESDRKNVVERLLKNQGFSSPEKKRVKAILGLY